MSFCPKRSKSRNPPSPSFPTISGLRSGRFGKLQTEHLGECSLDGAHLFRVQDSKPLDELDRLNGRRLLNVERAFRQGGMRHGHLEAGAAQRIRVGTTMQRVRS